MTAVSLDSVTFRYSGAERDALSDLTLKIGAGSITWFYGSPGAGCSTLLLVAAGLAPRFTGGTLTGQVQVLGADPHTDAGRAELRGRVAYVTATPALQLSGVGATVWEEVAFAPANLGWPIADIRVAADAALARLRVAELAGRDPATLSGGETQRVVLASMLALAPAVWLLDEPGTALDHEGRVLLGQLLRTEAERGAAVLAASEDADAMLGIADRLVMLDAGAVALDGTPASLLAGEEVWSRGPGSTSIAALARAAASWDPAARLRPPYPLTIEEGTARWS